MYIKIKLHLFSLLQMLPVLILGSNLFYVHINYYQLWIIMLKDTPTSFVSFALTPAVNSLFTATTSPFTAAVHSFIAACMGESLQIYMYEDYTGAM